MRAPRSPSRRPNRLGPALPPLVALLLGGCGPGPADRAVPREIPVDVYADTGRTTTLAVVPPDGDRAPARASVWLAQVSPARPAMPGPPSPEAPAETLAYLAPTPGLPVDDALRPPLPRHRASLAVPEGARGVVELDVRVDERGDVAEVVWAGGSRDPALVRTAVDCARAMRFFPAQRAGRPVAVWCRERFEFGGAAP